MKILSTKIIYLGGDAFILQFDHNGVQEWATFYGGAEGDEIFYDVAAKQGK